MPTPCGYTNTTHSILYEYFFSGSTFSLSKRTAAKASAERHPHEVGQNAHSTAAEGARNQLPAASLPLPRARLPQLTEAERTRDNQITADVETGKIANPGDPQNRDVTATRRPTLQDPHGARRQNSFGQEPVGNGQGPVQFNPFIHR